MLILIEHKNVSVFDVHGRAHCVWICERAAFKGANYMHFSLISSYCQICGSGLLLFVVGQFCATCTAQTHNCSDLVLSYRFEISLSIGWHMEKVRLKGLTFHVSQSESFTKNKEFSLGEKCICVCLLIPHKRTVQTCSPFIHKQRQTFSLLCRLLSFSLF